MNMNEIWNWITSNWVTIMSVITSVIGIAAVIAKATPNTIDNKIVDWLIKIINVIGMNFGNTKNVK